MAEIPLRPKRSELGWNLKPWFHIASCLLMLAVLLFFFLKDRADGVEGTWLFFWGFVLFGAIIGLIGVPARLKYLNTHWRKGKHVYIETFIGLKDSFLVLLPVWIASAIGLVIAWFWRLQPQVYLYMFFGCLFTWDVLANFLWWRSLPE